MRYFYCISNVCNFILPLHNIDRITLETTYFYRLHAASEPQEQIIKFIYFIDKFSPSEFTNM